VAELRLRSRGHYPEDILESRDTLGTQYYKRANLVYYRRQALSNDSDVPTRHQPRTSTTSL